MWIEHDITKDIAKLKTQLKRLKYPDSVTDEELFEGDPNAYLPIVNYLLLDASKRVAKFIASNGYDLESKSDYKFIESAYEILVLLAFMTIKKRIHFNCKPPCNIVQFFAEGHGELKVRFMIDLATAIMSKHNALAQMSPKPKLPAEKAESYSGHSHLSFVQNSMAGSPDKSPGVFHIQSRTLDFEKSEVKGEVKMMDYNEKEVSRAKMDENVTVDQIKEMVVGLRKAVEGINGKVEKIQETVGLKLANLQAEVVLLSGKLNFIENNVQGLRKKS